MWLFLLRKAKGGEERQTDREIEREQEKRNIDKARGGERPRSPFNGEEGEELHYM